MDTETITAEPYTARQCPDCNVWVYCDDGPFAENDRTKTVADWLHYRDEHMPADDAGKSVIGFPYFSYNDTAVTAVREHRAKD